MSRILTIGSRTYTQVECLDEPGVGGACHEYAVGQSVTSMEPPLKDNTPFAVVHFQNGPIKENGVNGCHQEDLIAIVIDRLQCFQKRRIRMPGKRDCADQTRRGFNVATEKNARPHR